MYDQSFTEKTLSKILKPVDFFKVKELNLKKEDIIKDSITRVKQGFDKSCLPILKLNIIKKNNTYKLLKFSDELALRKASKNIKVKSKIKQLNRNLIIENLITLLSENVQYKIYRLDINKFYESVNVNKVIDDLKSDSTISRQTVILISSFLKKIQDEYKVNGLPRGIFLSSILAERTLKFFDETVKNNPDVFFYSRFVDDIIIISSGDENKEFLDKIENILNEKDLSLNKNKGKYYECKFEKNKEASSEFEYLGYKITINSHNGDKKYRIIKVGIATKKIKKIKTKIIKSLLDYCKNKNFPILLDRIKFLTGNYNLIDKKTKTTKKAGIFYNYNHITNNLDELDFFNSSLDELDSFLKKAILSNSGIVFSKFSSLISKQEKKQLLKYKFSSGFSDKKFYYFNARRYSEITKAWSYE